MPTLALGVSRNRMRLLATAFTVLLAMFVTTAAAAEASTAAGFNRTTFHYTTSLSTSAEASRYQVMVLQATDSGQIPALKAANPNLKIFMYSEALMTSPNDVYGYTSCALYSDANANHPDWFLLDQNGNRIVASSYTNSYIMDVGNPGYQQACAAHAGALAKQDGFDGVYLDDVTANVTWTFAAGVTSPQYPTPSAWESAMTTYLQAVVPQLHTLGLLVVGNIGGSYTAPGTWSTWTNLLDGSGEEAFGDSAVHYYWASELANAAWSAANGKIAILHTHDTTETGNTFGLATMLLATSGGLTWSTSNANYTTSEAWYPEYDTALALGAPTTAYTKLPNGVYERPFANGVVLVNPSGVTKTVGLGTGTFTGSGLSGVSTVNLAAWTGLIMLADSPTSGAVGNMSAPVLTGSAVVGQTLSASPGTWAGTPAPVTTVQWYRCASTATTSCSAISGANAWKYTVQSADVGQRLDVVVTATNSFGSVPAMSAQTAQIPTPTFSLSASPTSQTVFRGSNAPYFLTIKPINGFTGPVALSVTGLPSGATATFTKLTSTTRLTVKTTSASVGTSTLTVTGTAGQTQTLTLKLTVT